MAAVRIFIILLCAFLTLKQVCFSSNAFNEAVTHTALHQESSTPYSLKTIQGKEITMVAFTADTHFKASDPKLDKTIWVTVAPDIKKQCSQFLKENPHATHEAISLWIAQLLGLPEQNATKRKFVLFEVPVIQAYYGQPAQSIGIFRPCADPRIGSHTDGSAICPKQMNPHDKNISSDYKTWFINNAMSAYTTHGIPWTEYGYTYNWNPNAKTIEGVSEFVILKNTPIHFSADMTAEQYCR